MLKTRPTSSVLDPMTILQNRWYNCLAAGLPADPTMFQILQPSQLIPQRDQGLWTYENLIPPVSLTFNTFIYGAEQFFGEYAAVASEQAFPDAAFQKDIGDDVYMRWKAYVGQIQPP